jgi:plastocyanin
MSDHSTRRRPIARRGLLASLGGLASSSLFNRVAAAQEATPEWTPPEIPQPLPDPEGTPPPIVGAESAAENPVSGAPTSIEQPSAAGRPGVGEGTPTTGGEAPVTNPQQPAQPLATPVTGEQDVAPAATVIVTPDFQFDPQEVRIRAGEAVEWRNEGRAPQTVTGDPAWAGEGSLVMLPEGAEPWDAGIINYGDTVTHVFDVPGEYVYVSLPRQAEGMTGRVIVEP